jgi:hypothetical protein
VHLERAFRNTHGRGGDQCYEMHAVREKVPNDHGAARAIDEMLPIED